MGSKIVFISPDEKLAEKARQMIDQKNEKIDVYQGSLSEGLKHAKYAIKNGANIVISRGGTGSLIKRNLQVPVVNIETSSYDVINSINNAVTFSKKIGIVGFYDFISIYESVIEIMEDAFSAQITTATIRNKMEVNKKVKELYQSGIRVFIGGQMIVNIVEELGCHLVSIESGKESIVEAIRQAKHLLEVQLNEKEKTQMLKSIIDFAYDGVLGIDKNRRITVFNPVIEEIVGIPSEKAIGRIVDDVVENTRMSHVLKTGNAELEEIQQIGETLIATNRVPIIVEGEVVGVVATFQELEKIQKMERQIRKKLHLKGHVAKIRFPDIIGKSKAILHTKEKAMQFAQVDSTILIQGATGTGKELFAQSIHNASPRKDKPFIAVNCAALPENLLESELFGYAEGAFTGARKGGKAGLFELAHQGTIFLDEISEMSPKLQARFLRVLQEKEVVKIGDDKVIPVDIKIIAATNRDLYKQVEKGDFREDLYYRLSVLIIRIPTLKERIGDIPELVKFFIEEKSLKIGKNVESISNEALTKLMLYDWPGNVRQLENVIERAVVLCMGKEIGTDIILETMNGGTNLEVDSENNISIEPNTDDGILKQMELEMIRKVLEDTNGNKSLAAERLGISVTTLWRRLKDLEK